jgi:hypothetical protein
MFSSADIEVPPLFNPRFSKGSATSMMPLGGIRRIDRWLIHPSVSWPFLPGHPEEMKMEPSPTLFSHQCLR